MAFTEPEKTIAPLALREGMVVADLGCGPGDFSVAAGKRVGTTGKVYAIDIQKDILPTVIDRAKDAHLNNVETIWGDIEDHEGTGLRDSLVDAVIISNIFFQVEDKRKVLEEAFRILKSGGRILAVDWSDSFGHLGPTPEMIYSRDDMRGLFESFGMKVVNTFETGDHHYAFIFEKQ